MDQDPIVLGAVQIQDKKQFPPQSIYNLNRPLYLVPKCHACMICLLMSCAVLFYHFQMKVTPPALIENMLKYPYGITKQQKSIVDI